MECSFERYEFRVMSAPTSSNRIIKNENSSNEEISRENEILTCKFYLQNVRESMETVSAIETVKVDLRFLIANIKMCCRIDIMWLQPSIKFGVIIAKNIC